MSATTKVFIVLQVVLAILLSAGMIVFVNRTEDSKKAYAGAEVLLAQANSTIKNMNDADRTTKVDYTTELQAKDNDLAQVNARLQDMQTQLDGTKTSLAGVTADRDKEVAANTFASQALKVALDQNGTLQSQYSALQQTLSTIQKEDADNTMAIADLRSRLEATERERKFLAEQKSQEDATIDHLQAMIKQAGINPNQTASTPINPEPNIALDGKIQDTRVIDGVPYGTISIGSADQVTSGMQFKVIDPQSGTFLGYLKVDTVEPHAASGRLDGPHVNDVHAGNEVRTQL